MNVIGNSCVWAKGLLGALFRAKRPNNAGSSVILGDESFNLLIWIASQKWHLKARKLLIYSDNSTFLLLGDKTFNFHILGSSQKWHLKAHKSLIHRENSTSVIAKYRRHQLVFWGIREALCAGSAAKWLVGAELVPVWGDRANWCRV